MCENQFTAGSTGIAILGVICNIKKISLVFFVNDFPIFYRIGEEEYEKK